MRQLLRLSVLLVASTLARATTAQCTPHWDWFPQIGCGNSSARALAVDSSASTPLVYVAGDFTTFGGTAANGVAVWNGTTWSALGSGVGGAPASVNAAILFDDDGAGPHATALYVAGSFTTAGGASANRIAKWNGSSWSALGSGLNSDVYCLAIFDADGGGPNPPALCAGGLFTSAGGVGANYVAKWNGSAWSALGSGVGGVAPYNAVYAMTTQSVNGGWKIGMVDTLVVGGTFAYAGGNEAASVARWNGSTWSRIGNGLNTPGSVASVRTLTVFDEDGAGPAAPALYAGGDFLATGGFYSTTRCARWDGTVWNGLGWGVNNTVFSLCAYDDDGAGPHAAALHAVGAFSTAGGASASQVAKWSGGSWSALGSGLRIGTPYAAAVVDFDGNGPLQPRFVAAGGFTQAGNVTTQTSDRLALATWNGADWMSLGGGAAVDYEAWFQWNSGARVYGMAAFDEDGAGPKPSALFAGGDFSKIGNFPTRGVARWDGVSWSALGAGFAPDSLINVVAALDEDGPGPQPTALWVGGFFDPFPGGPPTHAVAKWNGTSWSGVEFNVGAGVLALATFDDDGAGPHPTTLYAAGGFGTTSGGAQTLGVARLDGNTWTILPSLINGVTPDFPDYGVVCSLCVFDDDGPGPHAAALYAGGMFGSINGVTVNNIAKWDGTSWTALGSGIEWPSHTAWDWYTAVYALMVYDIDGPGPGLPALIAGGLFSRAGGMGAPCIASWNGTSWSAVGGGLNYSVYALGVFDADGTGPALPSLHAAGRFDRSVGPLGQYGLNGFARWSGAEWSPVGGGLYDFPDAPFGTALAPFDEDGAGPKPTSMWIGGSFRTANALRGLGRWAECVQ